ncbi:MAG: hypothetical protein P8Q48_23005 [Paracoccaceae bacterium]|nr:hypothetical protein [Paracoccaceae bacterium]
MKEREREYRPPDTRTINTRTEKPIKQRDGGMADEFEALFVVRDETTPELKADDEHGNNAVDKGTDRGFER